MCMKLKERNLREFAAEGYNWSTACEEDRMYIDSDTQELVHPVHVELGHYAFDYGTCVGVLGNCLNDEQMSSKRYKGLSLIRSTSTEYQNSVTDSPTGVDELEDLKDYYFSPFSSRQMKIVFMGMKQRALLLP